MDPQKDGSAPAGSSNAGGALLRPIQVCSAARTNVVLLVMSTITVVG
jgi:hypothetical protein